jgi:hypothetical protein
MVVGDRQHHGLNRSKPERKRPGVVLDQDRDESLETADDGVMTTGRDANCPRRRLEVEVLRLFVIQLNRRALPFAPIASVTSKSIWARRTRRPSR